MSNHDQGIHTSTSTFTSTFDVPYSSVRYSKTTSTIPVLADYLYLKMLKTFKNGAAKYIASVSKY
jgi:hypothetical protein